MPNIHRLFVEKKPGYDIHARQLVSALGEDLGLALTNVRALNRYDIQGLTDAEFERAARELLCEPPMDEIFIGSVELAGEVLAIEYLPGQYDVRADSAAQCIAMLTKGARPLVRTAQILAFEGVASEGMERIKRYLINPVEAREASLALPETLELKAERPEDVPVVNGFISMGEGALREYHRSMGFAMSLADLAFVQKHFLSEERDPTHTELKVIDTYWSDHCRHTTFQAELTEIDVQDSAYKAAIDSALAEYTAARAELYKERPVTLMDMATLPVKLLKRAGKLPALDESEEINACSIKVKAQYAGEEKDMLVMFKNETHNHPTEIEPFGGAATCLGGAIRDPLSGRAYVYQAMRVSGSGDPRKPLAETRAGKLSQRKITTTAAAGYSSYGNQIGLATGQVKEYYHEGYVAKRMELGAVIAAAPAENVVRETPAKGDCVLLIGGRTGRDGCGGATGSSKAHTEDSLSSCGAEVQKGNPITERKLQRLFRNPDFTIKIKRCNDFGAGGVCVAIGELADSLAINLDAVPLKYDGLDGTELAISESQERMAVVVAPENAQAVLALADEENLEAVRVAEVTDDGYMTMNWRGNQVVRLSRAFLNTNGVRQSAKASVLPVERAHDPFQNAEDADLLETLGQLNVAAQPGLIDRFDSTIGRGTVLMPFGGARAKTPAQAMAALIPSFTVQQQTSHSGEKTCELLSDARTCHPRTRVGGGESETATIMAHGFDPELSAWSPFHGGLYAVVESVARAVATGGDYEDCYLTMQEYFERLGDKPERWGKPVAALLGAYKAQMALGRAAIGGKDSMSGSFENLDVPPTLVCFAVCAAPAKYVLGNEFKKAGSRVVLLDVPRDASSIPDFEALKANFKLVTEGVRNDSILSATALGRGGFAAAIAKACLGNGLGFELVDGGPALYVPRFGGFILELAEGAEVPGGAKLLGHTNDSDALAGVFWDRIYPLAEVERALYEPLEAVFPTQPEETAPLFAGELYTKRSGGKASAKIARPRVLIPVFPGTNCEYDSARAFEEAGAIAETFILRNLTSAHIAESLEGLAKAIAKANIVMLPGGFSAGDEPDGSGKFIAATLRSGRVADAIGEMLRKDGLMLGICNGFQALIKTGLVPYGEVRPQIESDATLAFNSLGRHISRIVKTRVTSTLSPWLMLCEPGEVHSVALSHGEGRMAASEATVKAWFERGMVATQYVDDSGAPSMDIDFNPNGAFAAIEGISSADGRVFGKMGHTERFGANVYKNVPGNYDQKLFRSGVKYFE